MYIRKLEPGDNRMAISHIYEASWKYAYQDIIPREYLESIPEGQWAEHLETSGRNTLVALEDGKIVGTSSYCRARDSDMEGFGEIISIYLLPEYMGRGIGRFLMADAIGELRRMGFSDIFLWVLEENERARHFYERLGFENSGIFLEDNIGGRDLREVQYRYYGSCRV